MEVSVFWLCITGQWTPQAGHSQTPETTRAWCAWSRGTAPTCCGGRVSPHARERLCTLHPHIMHDGIGPPRDRGTSDEDEEARGCLPLDEDDDSMSPMRRSQ